MTQLLVPGMTFPGAFSGLESGQQPSVSITRGMPSSRNVELKIIADLHVFIFVTYGFGTTDSRCISVNE